MSFDGGPTNGGGNGGAGGFDDFDDFIRDREEQLGEQWDDPSDPFADFGQRGGSSRTESSFDRGLVDAITRVLDGLTSLAGDALSPELRSQLERTLRDLLIALRDIIDALIERIDRRRDDNFEVEEIPID